ncbi:UDP-N-acetylmuramate dehydrogenase [Lachnospiraceae bacterium DSM 108991]|uniref:UDP-N-acetylenolpyruvoylglucosamine reductase n=2 Tax=Lachnospiraceae TaxID=186803 RepID=A0A921HZR3_9FIRM|nr:MULTISPECIES: UDP-N-acetylmuramate dehydrogenase [Lachnospiraceae]MBE5062681.1 UDP-N-acetylmuramate dehydrogenase [Claveliimonas monacensis]HJF93425.1 UDP-N-acetylmuramate dehydrogenase [Lachnoclostridium phocaeense]
MKQDFEHRLEQAVGADRVLREEPMKKHTTFRIGGPAQYMVMPRTKEEVQEVIRLCRKEEMPWYIIGNGSNLLVSDRGYRGVVIQLFRDFGDIRLEGTRICAQAGASLAKIAAEALKNSLAGFEFAAGIPGTLGGACIMNAGAYGGEMKDVLEEVTVLTSQGELKVLAREELDMGYRTSRAAREGYVVLEAVISLEAGDATRIREKMEDLKERRTSKQPLEYPSAGSTFKRPEGYFAGKLIEDAGLRGFRVGDAMVSEKHCGFVINCGNATAADVDRLIRQVQERVRENSGVTLEPEVKRLGEF